MASTRGQFIELVFPGVWWSTWREPEPHCAAVPPGDGDFEVGEAGVDQDRVVAAQVQRAGDSVFGDVQGAGGVQEVLPDPVGGGGFVAGQLEFTSVRGTAPARNSRGHPGEVAGTSSS